MQSCEINSIDSKQRALSERAAADKAIDANIEKLVKVHVGGEIEVTAGCWPGLARCHGFPSFLRGRRQKLAVATSELAESTISTTAAGATHSESIATFHRSGLVNRLVGKGKKAAEIVKIDAAMKSVQQRLDSLVERQNNSRRRALALKNAGKQDEAIRELKKSKAIEKQIVVTNAAMDALERQEAALAQSSLQRELAAALTSTNQEVKKKQRGLLGFAESAVEESTELHDDAEDIGAVFEGLVASADTGVDDDELLAELDAMVGEVAPAAAATAVPPPPLAASVAAAIAAEFPSVPRVDASAGKVSVRTGLLSGAS